MTTTGVGGVFTTAEDPQAMTDWYANAFGLEFQDFGDGTAAFIFGADDGPGKQTLFGFMKARSDVPRMPKNAPPDEPYGDQPFLVNLKTDDIEALFQHLREMDTDVRWGPTMEGVGRFAWVTDLEGNRVEIWQPE